MQLARQLINEKANDVRQWLRHEMIIERGEIAPIRVAAQNLYGARNKHEAKDQPTIQPNDQIGTAQKNCDKAHFEQQIVPLELQEILTCDDKRQVQSKKKQEQR